MTAYPQQPNDEKILPLECDPCPHICGVLLSDKIRSYVNTHCMIAPFSDDSLEAAGYQMRVGEIYYHRGDRKELHEGDTLQIDPYDVVIIQTAERLRVPRFMIARWNIKVRLAYEGLLWVGAAQVDPGYVGHLACPIYNLSTRAVRIRRNDKLALIDFVKTTRYDESDCKRYSPKSNAPEGIDDFIGQGIESALSKYDEQIENLDKDVQGSRLQLGYFTTLIFTFLGVLFAVLLAEKEIELPEWSSSVLILSLAFSIVALILSCRRRLRSRFVSRPWRTRFSRPWWMLAGGLVLMLLVASFLLGRLFG